MRRSILVGAGAAVLVVGGAVAYWTLTPRARGLAQPRVVMSRGDLTVDGKRTKVGDAFAAGATVVAGDLISGCFAVHASRVCAGSGTQVRLAELAEKSATLVVDRGALVVASAGDALTITAPGATVQLQGSTAAVELSGGDPVLRVLEGSATLTPSGKPGATVSAPDAVGLKDGAKRPPLPVLADEERQVARLAGKWMGTAGAILQVKGTHGRIAIDDLSAGPPPVAVLLNEGEHTLARTGGPHDGSKETLTLRAGDDLTREQ